MFEARRQTNALCGAGRAGAILLMLAGCAGPRPVLAPNAHYDRVGQQAAAFDIARCEEKAAAAGAKGGSGKTGKVATETAIGAGVGAASGAVGGAIVGDAGIGAAIGAASGAVWGFLMGLFTAGSEPPSEAYVNFVNRCLQQQGYEVSAWE